LPLSFDTKQAFILEEKQDLNVSFKSFLIEYGIMEIQLCYMVSMHVVRPAFMNDILKLKGDVNSCYHPRAIFFYVFIERVDRCIVDVT
jgi:hypothetical protein